MDECIEERSVGDEMAIAIGTASRYADVVVKTWLSKLLKRPVAELFPNDPMIDFIGHVRLEPRSTDANSGGCDGAFKLQLAVVDSQYLLDMNDVEIRPHVAMLLKAAHLFIRLVVEKHVPEHASWIKPLPTPFGTILIPGLPPDAPCIGVVKVAL